MASSLFSDTFFTSTQYSGRTGSWWLASANPPKRVSRPEACGLRHLAFCVESVEQTVKELAEVGIECEPIRVDDFTGKKMTFFHDPDGLPLELHE